MWADTPSVRPWEASCYEGRHQRPAAGTTTALRVRGCQMLICKQRDVICSSEVRPVKALRRRSI